MNFLDHLKDEEYFVTGSSVYCDGFLKPNDIDICVLCNNEKEHVNLIMKKISSFCDENNVIVNSSHEYKIPFTYGGKTFARVSFLNYDVFLVDKTTFFTVKETTRVLTLQPPVIKELMISKRFRVDIFQFFASKFYRFFKEEDKQKNE